MSQLNVVSKADAFGVVMPAAGSGARFGGGDKLLVDLNGRSVLQRSVGLFARRWDVSRIVIVTGRERFDAYAEHLSEIVDGRKLLLVEGGRERWESVMLGLQALAGVEEAPRWVAVHDAARPLTPEAVIGEVFEMAKKMGGALPCVAEPATLKRRSGEGRVSETVDRRGLYQAQTPQCFELHGLLEGYERLRGEGRLVDVTDDAQVFERNGRAVAITEGAAINLKITTGEDAALARAILALGQI